MLHRYTAAQPALGKAWGAGTVEHFILHRVHLRHWRDAGLNNVNMAGRALAGAATISQEAAQPMVECHLQKAGTDLRIHHLFGAVSISSASHSLSAVATMIANIQTPPPLNEPGLAKSAYAVCKDLSNKK